MKPGIDVVQAFAAEHLDEARRLGWTEVDLFGCYPDPAFALVRYDCMGAITVSAVMGWSIETVTAAGIGCTNGLANRRPRVLTNALPVWGVFPPSWLFRRLPLRRRHLRPVGTRTVDDLYPPTMN
jgi:hypothetical protein